MRTRLEINSKLFFLIIGILLFGFVGLVCNQIATASNGGKMPVLDAVNGDETHLAFEEKGEVNNYYLSDIMKVPYKDRTMFFSIGDLIMVCALLLYLILLVDFIRKMKRLKNGEVVKGIILRGLK